MTITKTPIQWTQADADRFWGHVAKRTENECWEWVGNRHAFGYGKFSLRNRTVGAHVFSFAMANQGARSEVIRHACANPPCVNPKHLLAGTVHDNVMDTRRDGHSPTAHRRMPPRPPVDGKPFGRSIWTARLDEPSAMRIRDEYAHEEVSVRDLAKRWGVSKSLIHNIVTGKAWAHV